MLLTSWLRGLRARNCFSPSPMRHAHRSSRRRLKNLGRGHALAAAGLERLEQRILLSAVIAHDDSAQVLKTMPTDIDVLANDEDNTGMGLSIASVDTTGTLGTVEINGGYVTYTAPPGFTGADSFEYTAEGWEYQGAEDPPIRVTDTAIVTVQVINRPPFADDDSYGTWHDTALTVGAPGVLENDGDDDFDPLTAVLDSGPAAGTLAYFNADGSFEYVPPANWAGTATVTYHVTDGLADSDPATVTIDVWNSAPEFLSDPVTTQVPEDLGIGLLVGSLDCQDFEGDVLQYSIQSGNAHGRFELVSSPSGSTCTWPERSITSGSRITS